MKTQGPSSVWKWSTPVISIWTPTRSRARNVSRLLWAHAAVG